MSASRLRRIALLVVWVALIATYAWYTTTRDLGPLDAAERLRGRLADDWWGPVLFIVVYVLRPLVFFPAAVLTVLGGLAFGPIWGTLWTIIASNLSTAATYVVGRFFGRETPLRKLPDLLTELLDRAQHNPFETTLLMRLLYLPFDAVGYAAGFLRLRYVPFALGSALGTLAGTVAFVGFGASIDSLDEGVPSFDVRILIASLVLAVAGVAVSRFLRHREVGDPDHAGGDAESTSSSRPSEVSP